MSNPNNQTRKQHSAAFMAQIVLEELRESKSISQIASEHQLHSNLVTKWKQEAVAELPVVFERRNSQALPYSDPTVQAAVAQADTLLAADGATPG